MSRPDRDTTEIDLTAHRAAFASMRRIVIAQIARGLTDNVSAYTLARELATNLDEAGMNVDDDIDHYVDHYTDLNSELAWIRPEKRDAYLGIGGNPWADHDKQPARLDEPPF